MHTTTAAFDAANWYTIARSLGYRLTARGCIVTLTKRFAAGDLAAFADCDMTAPSLLAQLPATSPGSTWGTDGASVGGYSAVKHGAYTLNRSGISKRIVAKLAKLASSDAVREYRTTNA